MNEFTSKPEIIFISYDEVVKSPYPFILKTIRGKYRKYYEDFVDFSLIDDLDDENLYRFCLQRKEKNILKCIAKREFNYDKALEDIYIKFDDLLAKCELLSIGNSIYYLLSQKFTEKIYIHTPFYDRRIHFDIQTCFKDMDRVNYVTGDFYKVINKLEGITSYILNDIMDVPAILSTDKINYTNIMVANYGYNYTTNEEDNLVLRINVEDALAQKMVFKFATFLPFKLSEQHFSSINTPK